MRNVKNLKSVQLCTCSYRCMYTAHQEVQLYGKTAKFLVSVCLLFTCTNYKTPYKNYVLFIWYHLTACVSVLVYCISANRIIRLDAC